MGAIKAVVFDFDGLMFNTEEIFNLSGRELLRRRGLEMTPELLTLMMGRRADEAFPLMIAALGLTESAADLRAEERAIFQDMLWTHVAPMPGLLRVVGRRLKVGRFPRGWRLRRVGLTSSRCCGSSSWSSRFDLLLTSEDVLEGKPHPEIYLTAASRLGVRARRKCSCLRIARSGHDRPRPPGRSLFRSRTSTAAITTSAPRPSLPSGSTTRKSCVSSRTSRDDAIEMPFRCQLAPD